MEVVDLGKKVVFIELAISYARNHSILSEVEIEAKPQNMKEWEIIAEGWEEHNRQQNKLSCQSIEKLGQYRVSSSLRKSFKEKAVTAALVVGLLTGSAGCNVGQNNGQEKTEPVMPDPIEETLYIDREEVESIDIPKQEEDLSEEPDVFELPVRAENRLHINLDSNIVEYINNVHVAEGEVIKYPVFDTKEGQDHFENLAVFIDSLFDEDVVLNPDRLVWEIPGGSVSYGNKTNNFLFMDFEKPIEIPGVQINPESKESIQEGLKEITSRIVDGGFEHKIDQIVREGDYYIVHYRRLLNGIPFHSTAYQPYLYLFVDGKIKHAGILLREFEQIGEVSLFSGDEFNKNINAPDYPKTFAWIPPIVAPDYPNISWPAEAQSGSVGLQFHGTGSIYREGKDGGVADLKDVELVYYYRFLQMDDEKPPLPMFLLEGKGYINIPEQVVKERSDGKDKVEIFVRVLANAISFEHVKGYNVE